MCLPLSRGQRMCTQALASLISFPSTECHVARCHLLRSAVSPWVPRVGRRNRSSQGDLEEIVRTIHHRLKILQFGSAGILWYVTSKDLDLTYFCDQCGGEFCVLIRNSGAKAKILLFASRCAWNTDLCWVSPSLKPFQELSYPRAISSSRECGQHMSGGSEV